MRASRTSCRLTCWPHTGTETSGWRRTLLHRARQRQRPGTAEWAILERLEGLLWIAVQREVEGTFALDRADRLLDALAARYPALGYPDLEWLDPDDDRTGITDCP